MEEEFMSYKAVQYGCGPIGCSVVRLASAKPNIEFVGAIDLVNVGQNLGKIAETKSPMEVLISDDPETILNQTKPEVVLHTTSSSFEVIFEQLEGIIKKGINVVSTTEELSYSFREQPDLSSALDKLAKEYGVTVLGTGVNPGFLMDSWPLFMTGVCQDIKQIKAVRIQDATSRRIPFQKKIGAGTTIEEFNELVESGILRHVGIPESIGMIAAGIGWDLDKITESIEPVIAETEVRSDYVTVTPGMAAGVKQLGHGFSNGEELITLEFQACLGAESPHDAVYIKGTPDLEVVIKGGVHGDLATAAMVVNAIPKVIAAPPGFVSMKDLPIVSVIPSV
jgi:4-hydroxy-tetrahydrodipicolinate reductase